MIVRRLAESVGLLTAEKCGGSGASLSLMKYGLRLGDFKQCQRSGVIQSNHVGSIVVKLPIVAFHFVPIWSGDGQRKTEPCDG